MLWHIGIVVRRDWRDVAVVNLAVSVQNGLEDLILGRGIVKGYAYLLIAQEAPLFEVDVVPCLARNLHQYLAWYVLGKLNLLLRDADVAGELHLVSAQLHQQR